MEKAIKLPDTWLRALEDEFSKPYMLNLKKFLIAEKESGKVIFPKGADIFNALNTTPLDKIKVVILGQDPYHGDGQAHGLSFSVQDGIALPPSLVNIYKEIEAEFNCKMPNNGNLTCWAVQGVLLLNATLTVERGMAGSHQNKGWETFTDNIIKKINNECQDVVFLLWGSYAQKKELLIDAKKHLVLKAPHPSPLSAYRGFLGCGHFIKANNYLISKHKEPINWVK